MLEMYIITLYIHFCREQLWNKNVGYVGEEKLLVEYIYMYIYVTINDRLHHISSGRSPTIHSYMRM